MKYLLVLVVILFGIGLWRSSREPAKNRKKRASPALAAPQDMVECHVCGLHIPSADAVEGRLGLYCGHDHRRKAED